MSNVYLGIVWRWCAHCIYHVIKIFNIYSFFTDNPTHIIERIFSRCDILLNHKRNSMLPEKANKCIFLKVHKFWISVLLYFLLLIFCNKLTDDWKNNLLSNFQSNKKVISCTRLKRSLRKGYSWSPRILVADFFFLFLSWTKNKNLVRKFLAKTRFLYSGLVIIIGKKVNYWAS